MSKFIWIAFFMSGTIATCTKAASLFPAQKETYLIVCYLFGLLLGLWWARRVGSKTSAKEVLIGTPLGLFTVGTMFAFLFALALVPAVIAFPARNCGTLLLTTILSLAIWKEKLGTRGALGIAVGIAAVALLST